VKRNELNGLRIKLEREALAKQQLDRAVMEKKIQRLTMDKASQATAKTIELTRKKGEELVGGERGSLQRLEKCISREYT